MSVIQYSTGLSSLQITPITELPLADQINYVQVEQGMRILDLEAALTKEKTVNAELFAELADLKGVHAKVSELASQLERQRLELLAAQRTAQLAENALDKAQREIPALKAKLADSERERKALKGLNPEKLKKNRADQKKKTEEAKTAASEWKQKTMAARNEHKAEVKDLHRTLLQMLEEQDFFAEVDGYRLTLSRFRFGSDPADEKTRIRIRATNVETSESCVVKSVLESGALELLSGMSLPESVADRIRAEWESILETGKVTKESSDHVDLSLAVEN